VSAFLNKRIPAGAGLGGGSSDAASTLMALAAMWKLKWSASKLAEFSARLGSDVPFFFHGPSSICTGRGEIVRPTPPPARAKFAVLVLSDIVMPTPKVYAAFDAMKLGSDAALGAALGAALDAPPDFAEWAKLPADELMPLLVNDLEAPAFSLEPKLAATRAALEKLWNGKIVRMSGSGSSLFTLCDAEAEAIVLAGQTAGMKVRAKVVRLAPAANMSIAGAD
jgi:4-diphosphocytidyl-2-C-methyl-D-erythritol kinase